MARIAIVGLFVFGLLMSDLAAQEAEQRRSAAREAAVSKRRDWLRKKLTQSVEDEAQRAAIEALVDKMTGEEIDRFASEQLTRLQQQRDARRVDPKEFVEAIESNRREAEEPARDLGYQGIGAAAAAPGFFPIISWFPTGTYFHTSAFVGPDGRYVTTSLYPYFSSIGPVYHFDFVRGHYYPVHGHPVRNYGYHHHHHYPLGYGSHYEHRYFQGPYPSHASPHHDHAPRSQTWYDGLRTRKGPRPGR